MKTTIAQAVWASRYRYSRAGKDVDAEPGETFIRVAEAIAAVESDRKHWSTRYEDVLVGLRFLPGGRVLVGRFRLQALAAKYAGQNKLSPSLGIDNHVWGQQQR